MSEQNEIRSAERHVPPRLRSTPRRWSEALGQGMLFCLALSLLLSQHVSAQPELSRKHHLGVSVGISNYHNRDLMLSPLVYRGNNLGLGLCYAHEGGASSHNVDLSVAFGDINSNVPHHTQTGLRARISYGYSRRIGMLNIASAELPVFVGGLLKSSADMALRQDYDNDSWLIAHSLNFNIGTRHTINPRRSLYWDVHVPVVSYVIRPPHAGFDEDLTEIQDDVLRILTSNGEFVGPIEYLMLVSNLAYTHSVSSSFDLVARYRFSFQKFGRPRDVKTFINLFSAGWAFKL